jgi:galactose oxidase
MPMSRREFMVSLVAALPSALAFSGLPEEVFAVTDPRATTGQWSAPLSWPFIAIHATLLPNGKVLGWGRGHNGDPDATPDIFVCNPSTNQFVKIPNPQAVNLFCSGHAILWDGRVFIAGGHILANHGLPTTVIFNPVSNTLSRGPNMNAGRWYPTALALPNKEMLIAGGTTESGGYNAIPQVYSTTSGTYRTLTGALRSLDFYPRLHLAPDGKLALTGPAQPTKYLTTTGLGSWKTFTNSNVSALRQYGSSVMYLPGKILSAGGVNPTAIATAEVIDLNKPSPVWRLVGAMRYRRRHLNLTLLPDLKVLVSGGTTYGNSIADAVLTPELWDPATESFTNLAPMQVKRVYHSTALLLPNGKVLHLGGNSEPSGGVDEFRAQLFSPPYLFKDSRAEIASCPTSAGYGQKILVSTANSTLVKRVTLVKLGSVTHAFNMGQRGNELSFQRKAGTTTTLEVTTPANVNSCPPGHYMLFLITATGVPSTAKVIQIM